MERITKKKKKETIDYSEEKVKFFEKEKDGSNLKSYNEIIQKIKDADKILIASTDDIYENIVDALYQKNPYIIVKSLDFEFIKIFNEINPAIIREVSDLENDFIIIDNEAFIFLNPLSEKENVFFEIDSKDAKLIFNYYFWDKAQNEKFINKIIEPKKSPYIVGKRDLENVSIKDIDKNTIYAPIDLKYRTSMRYENKFICEDLVKPIFQNEYYTQIGKLAIKEKFEIKNCWRLQEEKLGKIPLNKKIIPFNSEEKIYVKEWDKVSLGEIRADTIEDMEYTKPNFKKIEFIKKIDFQWVVLPPVKPKNAKKAKIYEEFEKLEKEIKKYCDEIEDRINYFLKEAKLGEKKKLENNLKKLNDFRNKNIKELSTAELEDFVYEFKNFYNEVFELKEERKENELQNIRKKTKKEIKLTIPKYVLPEVGVLYENKESYFLEIEYYEELDKANELKERYIDKAYKVVVKDENE